MDLIYQIDQFGKITRVVRGMFSSSIRAKSPAIDEIALV